MHSKAISCRWTMVLLSALLLPALLTGCEKAEPDPARTVAVVGDIKITYQELSDEFTLFQNTYNDTSRWSAGATATILPRCGTGFSIP